MQICVQLKNTSLKVRLEFLCAFIFFLFLPARGPCVVHDSEVLKWETPASPCEGFFFFFFFTKDAHFPSGAGELSGSSEGGLTAVSGRGVDSPPLPPSYQ